ncbi:MAG: M3 family metallopeptidase, partial [Bacteroidota bacterium]
MEPTLTGAENVHWNLTDLYLSDEAALAALEHADGLAEQFATAYRGQIAGIDAEGLQQALDAFETIHDHLGRVYTYAFLRWTTDTNDDACGRLLQQVKEGYTQTVQQLIFFELEWIAVDDDAAEALMAHPLVAPYRHYLEVERLGKPHRLTEPEERILTETNVTGRSAWTRLFDETLGTMRYDLDGESITQQQVLSKLYAPDRDLRRRAALAFTEGLEERQHTLTYIFNTVLADKATKDRLRSYPSWVTSRNRANEVQDEVVQALVDAVTSRYDLVARFYTLKAKLLGVDTMMDYDRYAPVGEADTLYGWNDARELVTASYQAFHPEMGTIVEQFFEGQWIDAALAPGKRGGAFSHGAVPSAHPYILMNYTGKIRDVQTLAHELGHGVHQYLSRQQGVLHADTPLTT